MKKQICLSAVVITTFLMVSISANAQEKLSLGLKGGANSTFYKFDSESPYSNSSSKFGGSVGGFLKYDFGNWFALQTDLMVHYRNSEMQNKFTTEKSTLKSLDLELPVYSVFQFNLESGRIFFGIGPYIGYGIRAKTGDINMFNKDITGKSSMKHLNYGAATMLGYHFGHVQISASYISQNGIGKIQKGSVLRRQTFDLGIGYSF